MPENETNTLTAEAQPSEPDPISEEEKTLHLEALNKYGSQLCPVCNGLGFSRPEKGVHLDCPRCKGNGSVPLPAGVKVIAELFNPPGYGIDTSAHDLAVDAEVQRLVSMGVSEHRARDLLG